MTTLQIPSILLHPSLVGIALACFYLAVFRRYRKQGHLAVPLSILALLIPLPVGIICIETFFDVRPTEILYSVLSVPNPTAPESLLVMIERLQKFVNHSPVGFALLVSLFYTTVQTFCIPGTSLINALFGALYGLKVAVAICITTATLGAALSFIFSKLVGTRVVSVIDRLLMKGTGIERFRSRVESNRSHIWLFLLSARISPLIPNWFMNLAAPVIGVPFLPFLCTTSIGLLPQTYLTVRGGALLVAIGYNATHKPEESVTFISFTESLALMGLALLIIMPSLVVKCYNFVARTRNTSIKQTKNPKRNE